MKKRYLISACIFALIIALVLVVLAMLPARPGVTKSNFDRIEKGMSFRDVNAILGKMHALEELPAQPRMPGNEKIVLYMAWGADDGGQAIIAFVEGVVVEATWRYSTETIIAKMQRWIGLNNGAVVPPPAAALPAPPVMAVPPPVSVPLKEAK